MIGYDNITCMQDDLRKDARLMEFNTLVNKVIYNVLCSWFN